jgi:hypothetical protein
MVNYEKTINHFGEDNMIVNKMALQSSGQISMGDINVRQN